MVASSSSAAPIQCFQFSRTHSQNRAYQRFSLLTQLIFAHYRALISRLPEVSLSCEHEVCLQEALAELKL